jgi:ribonuclease PH
MRVEGRPWNEIRDIRMTRDFLKYPEGSVLIEMGQTKVICTATMEDKAPAFLRNTGRGWLTSEYAMLPGSTHSRTDRESARGRVGGRTHEIQRLIGRSLRAVTDLNIFGERTIYIDCDVIQADGGTRTASITGGFVALVDLFRKLQKRGLVDRLDLNYEEDSRAEVDMNVVMTGNGLFIEIQGTAEKMPFSRERLSAMSTLAEEGIQKLIKKQVEILGDIN